MQRSLWVLCALAMLSGCGPTTMVEVEAASLGGATVTYVGNRLEGDLSAPVVLGVLDAEGRGTFVAPELPTDEIDLRFERDGLSASAPAICLPPTVNEDQSITRARYLMRRSVANGACFLVALEIDQGFGTITGTYDPSLFDDAPCGPWAQPESL
jgi:hypothetical protein